jgi:hypothetical protein
MSGTDVVRTKPSLFQKGHAKMGGRQKGTKNRFSGDLREAVVAGIQAVGFMEKEKKGWKHGQGGVQGFIEWLALHEPKTAAVAGRRAPGTFPRITRELRQDHDHTSAVLTVLQGGPRPERPRTRP